MNIYIDESGSFAHSSTPDAWCVVGAYVVSEKTENKAITALFNLKKGIVPDDKEIKLHDLDENQFTNFLHDLSKLDATFHAVATDSYMNSPDVVANHQLRQSKLVVEHIGKMKYKEGRQAVIDLRDRILNLSPQLYIQLTCQILLMSGTVNSMIPYYIQRTPTYLSHFRWRIDQKNIIRTNFEKAFEILGPPILQTISFSSPIIMIESLDYGVMKKYLYSKEEVPKHLKDTYGLEVGNNGGINIQKLIREDMDFVDSKESPGVQVADLLVSGLRKCLRLQWNNNELIAQNIGQLMVQAAHQKIPLSLVSLSKATQVNKRQDLLGKLLRSSARSFIDKSILSLVKS